MNACHLHNPGTRILPVPEMRSDLGQGPTLNIPFPRLGSLTVFVQALYAREYSLLFFINQPALSSLLLSPTIACPRPGSTDVYRMNQRRNRSGNIREFIGIRRWDCHHRLPEFSTSISSAPAQRQPEKLDWLWMSPSAPRYFARLFERK